MLKDEVDDLYARKERPLSPSIDEMHPRKLYHALKDIIA